MSATSISQGKSNLLSNCRSLLAHDFWHSTSGKLPRSLLGLGKQNLQHHAVLSRKVTLLYGHSTTEWQE